MTTFFEQLRLLLWKNYILRKRHKVRMVLEILWPLILFLILMWVRTRGLRIPKPACHLIEKTLPSVGGFPFLQNFICSLNNTCYSDYVEDGGGQKQWENAVLPKIVEDVTPILDDFVGTQKGRDELRAFMGHVESLQRSLILSYLKNSLRDKEPVKLRSFLKKPNGEEEFRQSVSAIGKEWPDLADQILDTTLNLNEFDKESYDKVDIAPENGCQDLKHENLKLVTTPTDLYTEICGRGYDFYSWSSLKSAFNEAIDTKNALYRKLKRIYDLESKETKEFNPSDEIRVFGSYGKIIQNFQKLQAVLRGYDFNIPGLLSNQTDSTGNETDINEGGMAAITGLIFKGFCGLEASLGIADDGTNNYDTLRDRLREYRSRRAYKVDPDVSDICNTIFRNLERRSITSVIWKQIKPFIRGRLLYYPLNEFTLKLMKKVDDKFSELKDLENVFNQALSILHRFRLWFDDHKEDLRLFQEFLNDEKAVKAIMGGPGIRLILNLLPFSNGFSTDDLEASLKPFKTLDLGQLEIFLESVDFSSEMESEILNCIRYRKSTPFRVTGAGQEREEDDDGNKRQFAFKSEDEVVSDGLRLMLDNNLWAAIIFEDLPEHGNPTHLKYKIRMDSDKVDGTRVIRERITRKSPRRRPTLDLKYLTNGFIYIQEMIEHSFIEILTNQGVDEPKIEIIDDGHEPKKDYNDDYVPKGSKGKRQASKGFDEREHAPKGLSAYSLILQQFPYPCYIFDQFIKAISSTFPLFMVLSWVYASSMLIKSIVLEKELRVKEVMRVMGCGNMVIWTAWFIDSFIMMSLSSIILSLILKFGNVIEHSDFFIILMFLIIFSVATIFFSFLVSTFFTKANSAAASGGILFFVSYLPYNFMLLWEDRLTWYHTMLSCLISNVAFGFGCTYIARLEEDGLGAQWDRIARRTAPGDDFSFSYCILMLIFDSILYLFLALYIEAVFPGENGVPRKWYFPVQKSFWFPKAAQKGISGDELGYMAYKDLGNKPVIESDPEGLICGVSVQHLCKKYNNGRIALSDLNLSFYEGQITSFLGHNGAGKTTTISILTGLFPPSEGTAFIYGFDIRKDISVIRRDLGICPQHNVLFDRLTVEEHLIFYAGLKGKEDVAKAEMDQMLLDLGIPHKKNEFPKNLSGGMKRKLSVAIAFVGGSRTVFLDEPTSGVDPYSRRSIWELLLKYKQGRTIILTTHFMDEADILGDRIAIISRGQLKACGTSLFLKAQFGQGYFLRLVREIEVPPTEEILENNVAPSDSLSRVTMSSRALSHITRNTEATQRHALLFSTFIRRRIPQATMVSDAGSDIIFLLPSDRVEDFQVLFKDLDQNMGPLRLLSYGISDTSLEDVFLQITVEDLEQAAESGEHKSNTCYGYCYTRKMCAAVWRMRKNLRKQKKLQETPSVSDQKLNLRKVSPEVGPRGRSAHEQIPNGAGREPDHSLGSPVIPLSSSPSVALDLEDSDTEAENVLLPPPTRRQSSLFGIRRKNIQTQFWVQIWVIILKRFRNSNRNKKAIFFEVVVPALFIALMLASTLILPPPANEESREVTFTTYPAPNTIFYAKTGSARAFDDSVSEITGPHFIGTPCLDENLSKGKCNGGWSKAAVSEFLENGKRLQDPSLGTCTCRSGAQMCGDGIEKPPPPQFKTRTKDVLLDVSKYRVSEWVTKTYFQYDPSRLGGFEMLDRPTQQYTVSEFVSLLETFSNVSDLLRTEADRPPRVDKATRGDATTYKIWFENRAWLSSTAYLNALNNVILRQKVASYRDDLGQFGITLFNHPMNLTKDQQEKESIKTAALGVIHAICVIFALSFVPASFTVYLIEERKSGAKHLHLISGVKPITYWVSNLSFDMVKYLFSAGLCLILFFIFDAKAYIAKDSVASFVTLLILYGWAAIPLMYPASYVFSIPSTAFVVLACLNLFIGIITTVSTFVLDQLGDEELKEISEVLQKLFLIFPHYCLGRGLIELVKLHVEATAFNKLDLSDTPVDRFAWNILGKLLVCLAVQGFCFFLFSILAEYKQWVYMMCCKKRIVKKELRALEARVHSDDEDEDVQREAIRVTENPPLYASLLAQNLGKIYSGKKRPAVNNLCFSVEPGECFGLLGVNGAGKSTTFKMLTGDVRITSGKAFIMGYDVEKSLDMARKHYGYCPQEDGIDPLLNSYEQLELYGRLRGLTLQEVQMTAAQLIASLGLTRYATKRCGTYSGGNKRKISTAIALIGNPDVLFLDEPTSGMDPGARRQLWKLITAVTRMGKSVVLTSHSMEECEALCSRLAIMVNGRFTCLGSLQHLKNRFGKGYRLTVRCPVLNQEAFLMSLHSSLPFAVLEDVHCAQLKFSVPQEDIRLSDIFSVMCIARAKGQIEDFSVSQTTLDDIFIKFASEQRDELDGKLMEEDPVRKFSVTKQIEINSPAPELVNSDFSVTTIT